MSNGFEPFTLDDAALRAVLTNAPLEFTPQAALAAPVIGLPTPDGGLSRFAIVESPIMEPGLAAKFPEIKTYAGRGIDDPAASVRFDFSPTGFHAQVLAPNGGYNVEPYWHLDTSLYASYFHADQLFDAKELFEEELGGGLDVVHADLTLATPSAQAPAGGEVGAMANGDELRTYRLAVAATSEFTHVLGTNSGGVAPSAWSAGPDLKPREPAGVQTCNLSRTKSAINSMPITHSMAPPARVVPQIIRLPTLTNRAVARRSCRMPVFVASTTSRASAMHISIP